MENLYELMKYCYIEGESLVSRHCWW